MRQALAVAAKAPQPGTVKTRLHSLLSKDEATELYRCFLKDTLALVESVPAADPIISYTPIGSEHFFDGIVSNGARLLPQRGASFGDKLFHALADLLDEGYSSAAIMDADSPTLPREYLVKAFEELRREGDRVVLGPAADGGYYLIGVKQPHRHLFDRITWSTELVLGETVERAREIGLEVVLLPEWYDVDSVDELRRLRRELTEDGHDPAWAENTRRFMLSRWPAADAFHR
ncbi:MAG TPA: TIGR04282 family arsenosugar biosynthesis glycosyltransferase [Blastocatellia bacterium]|nr:TIGR04282 family arsenosugar biosynthesis glycosyltransferase [Blastocatellia bacterium]